MFHIIFLEKTLKNRAILNLQGCKKASKIAFIHEVMKKRAKKE